MKKFKVGDVRYVYDVLYQPSEDKIYLHIKKYVGQQGVILKGIIRLPDTGFLVTEPYTENIMTTWLFNRQSCSDFGFQYIGEFRAETKKRHAFDRRIV